MTTETDKLVEMARAAGFYDLTNQEYQPTTEQLAASRAAIIADMTADVEPVWDIGTSKLYPASTVAALKARVAALEKDAARGRLLLKWLRDGRIPGPAWGRPIKLVETCPQFGDETEVKNIGALLDAALTKGQQ